MDGAMGKEEEVVEAVLTCEGDFHDPELLSHVDKFKQKLTHLLLADEGKLNVKKIEPWNSVKVTFTIPREAALRLRQLAQSGDATLKEMGVLSVQLQGDSSISLTIAGRNNETTEIMLRSSVGIPGTSSSIPFNVGGTPEPSCSADDVSSIPGLSNEEVTRKNIVDYLTQGPSRRQNTSIFDTILGVSTSSGASPVFESSGGVPSSPNLFPGQLASGLPVRPSQMTAIPSLPIPTMRGSQKNAFPLSKGGSGAFHVPLPNQSSAGQSTSSFYAQRMNSTIAKNTPNQPGPMSMPLGSPQPKNMHGGINTFGPVGLRLPPSMPVNNAIPPSSSPGIMMDLPPPPPYPHSGTSNAQRPGKQKSASSPLLVNLLQTDPLAVTAGGASGNPNKAISAEDSTSTPPQKKKRPKKSKEGASKASLSFDPLSNNRDILGITANMFNPINVNENPRGMASSVGIDFASIALSKFTKESLPGGANDMRTGLPVSHIAEPVKPFKPLISSDRPYSESVFETYSSSVFSNLSTYKSSAIGTGNNKSVDSNGQGDFSQEPSDLFSLEIAAGKIINPYTGQLEPRDSIPESIGGRMRDYSVQSRERSALPAVMVKKDVGSSSFKNVPVSVSQLADINVLRTYPPVSSSTAAFVHSGPPTQISSDRLLPNFPPHRRNVISDNNDGLMMNIYAARLNSKRETEHNFTPVVSAITQSLNSQQHRHMVSSNQNVLRTTSSSLHTSGENFFSQALPTHPNVMPQTVPSALPPHSMPIPTLASRVSATLSGSVITSELTHSSSFPMPLQSNLVQSQSNPISFHPTSCASSTARSPSSPHVSSLNAFPSSSFSSSSSSSSIVQTPPFSSSAQSVTQVPERSKSTNSSTRIPYQLQAASEATGGTSVKSSYPNLLNPLPDKTPEPSQNMERSPPFKISFEGDDNSNHSGMVVENVTESSGTSVLLEHSGVKAENHDSGVGSSSERSDDTPSEPGDGEFRSNSNGTEAEDASGKAAKRLVNCKVESGVDSSTSNTITVGYMMTSMDCTSQPSLLHSKDAMDTVKLSSGSMPPMIPDPKADRLYDSHARSAEKPLERLSSNHTLSSMSWVVAMNKNESLAQPGKAKQNGPMQEEKDLTKRMRTPEIKLNGPNSEDEIGKMFIAMDDLQDQHSNQLKLCANMKDNMSDHLKLKEEELDEIVKLNRADLSPDIGTGKLSLNEKGDSPDHLSHSLDVGEDRLEHFNFFDMEDLVNGKPLGNGAMVGDNKTGSNITSIYSKRSSPVNVNMLNHIYAPGLPLPRRLTESVQRLVKPLPVSETSMPQMRLCKSPGMVSPRAVGTVNGPSASRMSLHSGTRSPGASVPKLIPNDKHSLLSGGLDLAGLSSVSYQQAFQASDLHLGSSSVSMRTGSHAALTDFPTHDSQLLSSSSSHVSSIFMDSVVHPHKILSQSYPPHKSRDLASNASLYDLFSHMQPPPVSGESFSSLATTTHNSKFDSNSIQASKTNCDSDVSSPFSKSHLWNSANRQQPSKEGALLNHAPVTSCHPSSNSKFSLSLPTSDNLSVKSEESASHSRNFFSEVVSSSPEHSNTILPSALALPSKDFADHVANSTIQSSQSFPVSSSSGPWSKVSLTNGGSSAAVSVSSHQAAVSTSRHMPYLAHSSAVATSSLESSAGALIPKAAPCMSNAFLSATKTIDVCGNSLTAKSDNVSPLRPSPKSDISSPRTGTSTPSYRRNLFESVSELGSLQTGSSHVSLCRTLGAALPSHPDSVLDANQSLKTVEDTLPVDDECLDMISLQSIRTNETPPTSLPAQVVHLDFPHYSSSSTASLCTTGIQPDLSKPPISSTSSIPASLQHSVLTNSNWPLSGTSSTSFLTLPTKSSGLLSTHDSSAVDSIAMTIASVASSRSDTLSHASKEKSNPPISTSVKEPILETLAATLDPFLSRDLASPPCSDPAAKKSTTTISLGVEFSFETSEESLEKDAQVTHDTPSDQTFNRISESGVSQQSAELPQESQVRKGGRKRALPGGEEHKDAQNNSLATDSPPAKRLSLQLKPSTSKIDISFDPGNPATIDDELRVSELGSSFTGKTSPNDEDQQKAREFRSERIDSSSQPRESENVASGPGTEGKSTPVVITSLQMSEEAPRAKEIVELKLKEVVDPAFNGGENNSTIVQTVCVKDPAPIATEVQQHVTDGTLESQPVISVLDSEKVDLNKDTVPNEIFTVDTEEMKAGHGEIDEMLNEISTPLQSNQITTEGAKEEVTKENVGNASFVQAPAKAVNLEAKPDDSARKGRTKRQFYAYVPEKFIDQTYFDTPILSGRTRSRSKPTETAQAEMAPSQDSAMLSSGDPHAANNRGVAGKVGDASQENLAGKRSTRSLRTKETTPDPNPGKRRRIQSRDHR